MTNGSDPTGGLIADAVGDLFGTTQQGGLNAAYGAGTVFELTDTGFKVFPPAPPTGLALAAGSDSGVKGDRITNVTKPVITGKGAAGDTVTLYDGRRRSAPRRWRQAAPGR